MRQSGNEPGAKTLHKILTNIRNEIIADEDMELLTIGRSDPESMALQRHLVISLLAPSEIPEMARRANKRLITFRSEHNAVDVEKNLKRLPAALDRLAAHMPMKGTNNSLSREILQTHVHVPTCLTSLIGISYLKKTSHRTLRVFEIGTDYIPGVNNMIEGMELVFKKGNKNVDLGWASNNSCTLHSIVPDPREPPDDGTGPA
eukprot:scaffold231162_cov15-Prasinocladus_malaysianus.AAC.2